MILSLSNRVRVWRANKMHCDRFQRWKRGLWPNQRGAWWHSSRYFRLVDYDIAIRFSRMKDQTRLHSTHNNNKWHELIFVVNCVGRMYNYPDELRNVSVDVLWSLINMNIGAMITMTRIVVNRMKVRRKGAIVNISSGSELQPVPYVTLYAATKVNFIYK